MNNIHSINRPRKLSLRNMECTLRRIRDLQVRVADGMRRARAQDVRNRLSEAEGHLYLAAACIHTATTSWPGYGSLQAYRVAKRSKKLKQLIERQLNS